MSDPIEEALARYHGAARDMAADLEARMERLATAASKVETYIGRAREARRVLLDDMDMPEIEATLDTDLAEWEAALRARNRLASDLAGKLSDDVAAGVVAEVTAVVEAEFAATAEERKAQKLPNNETVRRAEVQRRLSADPGWQEAKQAQAGARAALAEADAGVEMAARKLAVAKALYENRTAQIRMLGV